MSQLEILQTGKIYNIHALVSDRNLEVMFQQDLSKFLTSYRYAKAELEAWLSRPEIVAPDTKASVVQRHIGELEAVRDLGINFIVARYLYSIEFQFVYPNHNPFTPLRIMLELDPGWDLTLKGGIARLVWMREYFDTRSDMRRVHHHFTLFVNRVFSLSGTDDETIPDTLDCSTHGYWSVLRHPEETKWRSEGNFDMRLEIPHYHGAENCSPHSRFAFPVFPKWWLMILNEISQEWEKYRQELIEVF